MNTPKEASLRKFSKRNSHLRHKKDTSSHSIRGGEDKDEATRFDTVDLSASSLDNVPQNPNSINPAAISKLNLSNNNLKNIPEPVMARLVNVVVLDVHSNQLTWLPNSIGCSTKLKLLNVSGNLLRSIPKTIENCRNLEEVNANFNNLIGLPETIGFELINLKKLSINSNKITLLPYSTSHLTLLHTLDVRLNRLRSLPEDLHNMVNLRVLNISQNFHYMEKLPSSIGLLPSLVELDIGYNKIKTIPTSLASSNLQKLCVEGNPLVSPPLEVAEMGLHAVKQYLHWRNEKEKKGKKGSWFKKHLTVNSRKDAVEREALPLRCQRVEAVASPRYLALLSPRRLLSSSPNSYYTKLG